MQEEFLSSLREQQEVDRAAQELAAAVSNSRRASSIKVSQCRKCPACVGLLATSTRVERPCCMDTNLMPVALLLCAGDSDD